MNVTDWILLIVLAALVGLVLGWLITYIAILHINSNTCKHEFEYIGSYNRISGTTKAFICCKCGKAKKVKY